MNQIAKQEPEQLPAESNTVSMFERLARDPSVDVEKLERLMLMKERSDAKTAEVAFNAALSEMQCELPTIGERGKVQGRYTYALWEDINTAIKPIMHKHGFALSFRTDFANGITVTAVLSHREGHSIQTSILLPADASGNKPQVQAVASSVSYGKRYTAGALLNLTSHGEDDDAYKATVERISEEQLTELQNLIDASKTNIKAFCKYFKIAAVADLSAKAYPDALAQLKRKGQAK